MLNKEEIESPSFAPRTFNNIDNYLYALPVQLGIELKYFWMESPNGIDILTADRDKLTGLIKNKMLTNWTVLGFVQREKECNALLRGKGGDAFVKTDSVDNEVDSIYLIGNDAIYKYNHGQQ